MINHSTLEYHVTNLNTFFRWAPIAAGINQNTSVNPRGRASYHAKINHLLRHDNLTNLNNPLTLDKTTELKISSYLLIAISSFISNCLKNRDVFLEDLNSRENAAS